MTDSGDKKGKKGGTRLTKGFETFEAYMKLNAGLLDSLREVLHMNRYTEMHSPSFDITQICHNPYAWLTFPNVGTEDSLLRRAQIQLEATVLFLDSPYYTVSNSSQEEAYPGGEAPKQRLSEYTLVEGATLFEDDLSPRQALDRLADQMEDMFKYALATLLEKYRYELSFVCRDNGKMGQALAHRFVRLDYGDAINLLAGDGYNYGDPIDQTAQRKILANFCNRPVFLCYMPPEHAFFNLKRTETGSRAYSIDLLLPRYGKAMTGGVKEEDADLVEYSLKTSPLGEFMRSRRMDPVEPIYPYFELLRQAGPGKLHGGFGLAVERFLGYMMGTRLF